MAMTPVSWLAILPPDFILRDQDRECEIHHWDTPLRFFANLKKRWQFFALLSCIYSAHSANILDSDHFRSGQRVKLSDPTSEEVSNMLPSYTHRLITYFKNFRSC